MKFENRKKIIEDLYENTVKKEIKWEVEIKDDSVICVYDYRVTNLKTIVFTITFLYYSPYITKLYIIFNKRNFNNRSIVSYPIIDLGGKNNQKEANDLNVLLNEILFIKETEEKEEERNNKF